MSGVDWVGGEVQWEATGADPHRLIGRVRDAGLPCREFCVRETPDGSVLTAWCPARAYAKLRPLVRRTGLRVRVRQKRGLWFRSRPLRRRVGLAVGLVIAAVVLGWMSGRIWVVQTPPDLSPELAAALPPFLRSQGVAIGASRNGIVPNDIEFQALEHLPGVVSLTVNMEGCIAHVEVVERAFGEEVLPPDIRLSNLVAARDGRILSMTVLSGQAAVKSGSGVAEGTLLVSGVVETAVGPLLHRAQGVIMAETRRTLTAEVPYTQTVNCPDDTAYTQTTLSVFGLEIPLYTPLTLPEDAAVTVTRRSLLLGGTELPLSLTRRRIRESVRVSVTYSEEQAKALALKDLERLEAAELKDAEIRSRTLREASDDAAYRLVAEYRCVEDIGREVIVEIHSEADN